jgi:hypothetical protein
MSTEDKQVQVNIPVVQGSIEGLIALGVEKGISVEALEKLVAMWEKLKDAKAEEAYNRAMAALQKEYPKIEKKKAVYERGSTKIRYKFAPMEDIVDQLQPLISKHGFSYSFDTKEEAGKLYVTCYVTHIEGHTKQCTFGVPVGSEQYMSDVQKYGARVTFCRRYSFCGVFGATAGEEDDDAVCTQRSPQTARTTPTPATKQEQPLNRLSSSRDRQQPKNRHSQASDEQKDAIRRLCQELGQALPQDLTKITSLAAHEWINALEAKKDMRTKQAAHNAAKSQPSVQQAVSPAQPQNGTPDSTKPSESHPAAKRMVSQAIYDLYDILKAAGEFVESGNRDEHQALFLAACARIPGHNITSLGHLTDSRITAIKEYLLNVKQAS